MACRYAPPAGTDFNPPTPCRVGRARIRRLRDVCLHFNPPTPCGVGLLSSIRPSAGSTDFNPPTPCGVGPWDLETNAQSVQFQSTHPVRGGTTGESAGAVLYILFQSTHPVRGGTDGLLMLSLMLLYFNPPTPCGVGHGLCGSSCNTPYFNPPTPCGVGPGRECYVNRSITISIHPPRAGWDLDIAKSFGGRGRISIHPPRAGWDAGLRTLDAVLEEISIHPPRAGWDMVPLTSQRDIYEFQSTHPVRGGTSFRRGLHLQISYFNPPTPCGVGL